MSMPKLCVRVAVLLSAWAVFPSLPGVSAAASSEEPEGRCLRIRAVIVDSSAPAGCTSPFHFCALGTIQGNHGLRGITYFVLDGVAPPPATAPGFVMTSGTVVITTPHGTLVGRQTGTSKLVGRPSNGFLAEVQEISSGTGRFAGATGVLYLNGVDVNSVFTSQVSGELCLPDREDER
jgi:hypothetical protein